VRAASGSPLPGKAEDPRKAVKAVARPPYPNSSQSCERNWWFCGVMGTGVPSRAERKS
jgi:hypothetical protein